MTQRTPQDVLKAAFPEATENLAEDELEDVVQDVLTAAAFALAPPKIPVDIGGVLPPDIVAMVGGNDGILLLLFRPDGTVEPQVVRLGLMTEGRLEASIMSIYMAINRARAQEHQKAMRESAEQSNG